MNASLLPLPERLERGLDHDVLQAIGRRQYATEEAIRLLQIRAGRELMETTVEYVAEAPAETDTQEDISTARELAQHAAPMKALFDKAVEN